MGCNSISNEEAINQAVNQLDSMKTYNKVIYPFVIQVSNEKRNVMMYRSGRGSIRRLHYDYNEGIRMGTPIKNVPSDVQLSINNFYNLQYTGTYMSYVYNEKIYNTCGRQMIWFYHDNSKDINCLPCEQLLLNKKELKNKCEFECKLDSNWMIGFYSR